MEGAGCEKGGAGEGLAPKRGNEQVGYPRVELRLESVEFSAAYEKLDRELASYRMGAEMASYPKNVKSLGLALESGR